MQDVLCVPNSVHSWGFLFLSSFSLGSHRLKKTGFLLLLLSLMGLTISWSGTCANNPIFAEVVLVKHRTMIYTFDRSFEGSFSAFAAPIVGVLSEELYGYNAKSVNLGSGSAKEAYALSRELLCMMAFPWALCALFYTPLYVTFGRDRQSDGCKRTGANMIGT